MPDKQNDNKIMSVLERTKIVRKREDDPSDEFPGNSPANYEPDIKPLFNPPDTAVRVTPAARQPVPGMPNPVVPSVKPADSAQIISNLEPKQEIRNEPEIMTTEAPSISEPEFYSEPPPEASAVPTSPAEQQRPGSSFGGLNLFRNGRAPEETSEVSTALSQRDQQPENYTDKYLNINELYDALALRSKKTDSIYLIEEYLQTLPDSLPDSSRREIVNRIISASGFDYDLLMGDGVLRVKMLKEYAERFARHTDDYIAARQAEIDEMDQNILRARRLIENRKELHKKQFFTIEAEAQRLKEILTFISG